MGEDNISLSRLPFADDIILFFLKNVEPLVNLTQILHFP